MFDHRISEMSDYKTSPLIPTWDCQPPSNLNDSDLCPEMKTTPEIYDRPTEAIFAVVRSQVADFTRHSAFHLDFIDSSLKVVARAKAHHTSIENELRALESLIEGKYLAFCDPENRLHFMTIWMARASQARNRLLDYYSRHAVSSEPQTNTQRNEAASYALTMLECDTKLRTHPPISGYMWLVNSYVPALATIHLVNDLTKRPAASHADRVWEVMSDNYEARTAASKPDGQSIFVVFARAVLQAWAAREAVLQRENKPQSPPNMVMDIRKRLVQTCDIPQDVNGIPQASSSEIGYTRPSTTTASFDPGAQVLFEGAGSDQISLGHFLDVDIDQFWSTMDWRQMHLQGW